MFGFVSGIMDKIVNFFIERMPGSVEEAVDKLKNAFSSAREFIENIFNAIYTFVSDAFKGIFKGVIDKLPSFIKNSDAAKRFLEETEKSSLNGQTSASINNNTTTANRNTSMTVGTINVNAPGGDPDRIAGSITTELDKEYGKAISDYEDGVYA